MSKGFRHDDEDGHDERVCLDAHADSVVRVNQPARMLTGRVTERITRLQGAAEQMNTLETHADDGEILLSDSGEIDRMTGDAPSDGRHSSGASTPASIDSASMTKLG